MSQQSSPSGLEHPGVLDAFAHDIRSDTVVLAMFEQRPWTGGDLQLFQLQEKLNAYVSFLLDGEFAGDFPELVGKPQVIQLRTLHDPSDQALNLLEQAREQLSLQQIDLQIISIRENQEAEESS